MEYLAKLNGTCVAEAELDGSHHSESRAVHNSVMLKQSSGGPVDLKRVYHQESQREPYSRQTCQ